MPMPAVVLTRRTQPPPSPPSPTPPHTHASSAAGDWLQGPYVYALYQHYGYSTGDIGKLFIAGFGSSMIFGTVVGSMGRVVCRFA
jgi:hypothetical protein